MSVAPKKKKTTCKEKLAAVRKALEEYYEDLDNHANVSDYMMRSVLTKIEKALDMRWGKA
jgi:DNA-binding protein Fis